MPPKKKTKAPPPHPKSDFIPVGTSIVDKNKNQEIVIGKALTEGGFGCIYEASVKNGQKKLIAKFEPGSNGPLFVEQSIYTRILSKSMLDEYCKKNNIKFLGLPYLVSNGIYEENRYIVIPKYDYCLEQLMKENQLSLNEIKQVVHCVLNALEYLHSSGYAHADIKAGNLMLNSKKNFSEVYLIDFGLTMKGDSAVDKENKKRAHNGSPFFTSVDAHRGIGPSYRGDIEMVGHNLLFWLTGTLPWLELENDLVGIMAAKQKLLANIDKELEVAGLGKGEKAMVAAFYEEARNLSVTEVPDFSKLRSASDVSIEEKNKTKKQARNVKKLNDNKTIAEQEVAVPKLGRGKVAEIAKKSSDEGVDQDVPTKLGKRKVAKTTAQKSDDEDENVEHDMLTKPKRRKVTETAKKSKSNEEDESGGEDVPTKRGRDKVAETAKNSVEDENVKQRLRPKRGKQITKTTAKKSSDEDAEQDVPTKLKRRKVTESAKKSKSDDEDESIAKQKALPAKREKKVAKPSTKNPNDEDGSGEDKSTKRVRGKAVETAEKSDDETESIQQGMSTKHGKKVAKATAKKSKDEENGGEDVPTKRGRGKVAETAKKSVEDENVKQGLRPKRGKQITKATAKKSTDEDAEQDVPTKQRRGKAAESAKKSTSNDEDENVVEKEIVTTKPVRKRR